MADPETLSRRTLLLASLAAPWHSKSDESKLTTLTDWMRAEPAARQLGLQACLARIKSSDASIHAWVQVAPQKTIAKGVLSEIPFAVKDVIETRGLATEYGSPVYKGRMGTEDAAIVRELRQRGALLLGKTHTAAFAYRDPGPTCNPRNPEHTPGGSSSGSAAAVAADMVPLAIGTQTSGSVLRPASYCGVTGFKPTYGLLSLEGVLPFAKSLDTLGFFTHTPADMFLLWGALNHPTGRAETLVLGVPEPMPEVDPEMAHAFREAVATMRNAGVATQTVNISEILTKLIDAQQTVAAYEGSRAHQQRFAQYGDRLGAVAVMVRDGLRISDVTYQAARRSIASGRIKMAELYRTTPVILVPAAPGPAPKGLSTTGDAKMNRPWTALGVPAISIPMPVGSALPLGLQLTASHGQDARLLRAAVRVARTLKGS